MTSAEYSRATHDTFDIAILDGALCTGNELHLLDCPRFVPLSNVTNECLGNYAGVTCMSKYSKYFTTEELPSNINCCLCR